MARPKNLPKWASDKTRPYGVNGGTIDQLEKNGYVAGDFPKHDDINRIGWDLEKWVTYLDKENTASTSSIDSISDNFTRRATGTGGNYPPPAPAEINTNDLIDKKVSDMEDKVSPIFQNTSETDYNDLELLHKNLNTRVNRKITNAIDTFKTPIIALCPDIQIKTVVSNPTGEQSNSIVQFEASDIALALFNDTTNTLDWNSTKVIHLKGVDLTFINGTATTSGVKVDFPQANDVYQSGFASGTSSLSSTPTIHIFAVYQEGFAVGIIADNERNGVNAVSSYKSFTNDDSAVFVRRITTTKVINTKKTLENDNYRFIQAIQVGDVVSYNAELRPRTPIDTDTPLLIKWGADSTEINLSNIIPSGVLHKYAIFSEHQGSDSFNRFFIKGNNGDTHFASGVIKQISTEISAFDSKSKDFTSQGLDNSECPIGIMPTGHYDKRID